ncbi:hypothetical protein BV898_14710 [Hypsibius exemplaris]|uniref:Uncharacterized protein n=1 Tax=Hypsibius exemplaris TaxID=2072580 RepID=A0A9X6N9V3_HYPEX|nr:hypothetical protein BV898_14710 [Hypsibius exemplaris]
MTPFPGAYGETFTWQILDHEDQFVRSAYRAVILMVLCDATGPAYDSPVMRSLVKKWQEHTLDKYNITASRKNLILPSLIAGHTAVELMAEAVNSSESLGWSGRQPSGKHLAEHLLHRKFDLQIGPVHMLAGGLIENHVIASSFNFSLGLFQV